MFRILKTTEGKKLTELSLKQREMLVAYSITKDESNWPSLSPRLDKKRPEPIVIIKLNP